MRSVLRIFHHSLSTHRYGRYWPAHVMIVYYSSKDLLPSIVHSTGHQLIETRLLYSCMHDRTLPPIIRATNKEHWYTHNAEWHKTQNTDSIDDHSYYICPVLVNSKADNENHKKNYKEEETNASGNPCGKITQHIYGKCATVGILLIALFIKNLTMWPGLVSSSGL